MIKELLERAGAKKMAITAFGGGRMVLAEPDSVEFDMGKRFLLSEERAIIFCQLMTCKKDGMPNKFVGDGECPGLPGKTKSISINATNGVAHTHEPGCEFCLGRIGGGKK